MATSSSTVRVVEQIEPIEPIEQIEAAERVEPLEQIEPAEPVEAFERVEPRIVSATFKNKEEADAAYEWLLKNGYNTNDIHILMSEETMQKNYCEVLPEQTPTDNDTLAGLESGAVFGGGLGAVLGALAGVGASVIIPGMGITVAGPLAASLAGAGGLLGGVLGALFGSSLPEEEARRIERAIREGSIQIGVRPRDAESAAQIENEWRSLGGDMVCS